MGRTLVPGEAEGPAVVLDEPLSFWGGMDPASGRIIDRRHPQRGADLAGRVVIMPSGRGSSSSSSVLAEAVRTGTAPAAILLREADPIVALGVLVARELYGRGPAVAVIDRGAHRGIITGHRVRVEARDGHAPVITWGNAGP